MNRAYRSLLRPILFSKSSEEIHDVTIRCLSWAGRQPLFAELTESFFGSPRLPVSCFGLQFPNPVGLAAGMDKSAQAVLMWEKLGFGFSELGGVTWHPQPGNPKPRIFRIIEDQALINRMGFNNPGARSLAEIVAQRRQAGIWPKHPVGFNLGKSKLTPLDQAAADYEQSFRALWQHGDFFVVNVSSPNTPNLRQLQNKSALDEILVALNEANHQLGRQLAASSGKPLLVKVAPDLSFDALDEILELVQKRSVSGLVATNTTIARPPEPQTGLRARYREEGGLSGKPLRAHSTEVVRHLYQNSNGRVPIIGVGGIFNAADAWEKIAAGASLIQVYTGLVYEGPGLAKSIVQGLQTRLEEHGFKTLSDAIGCENCRPNPC